MLRNHSVLFTRHVVIDAGELPTAGGVAGCSWFFSGEEGVNHRVEFQLNVSQPVGVGGTACLPYLPTGSKERGVTVAESGTRVWSGGVFIAGVTAVHSGWGHVGAPPVNWDLACEQPPLQRGTLHSRLCASRASYC